MQPSVQLLCFDLGGVVVRIHRSFGEAARAVGIPPRNAFRSDDDGAGAIVGRYQAGEMSVEAFCLALSEASGGAYSPAEFRAIHDAFIIEEYAGMASLLATLRAKDLELAVLSNTNASHWARMTTWPALAHFQHRLASHEIGAVKPDVAAYRAVEEASGVAGAAVLFFDDTAENIVAAERHGWRAERIDPLGDPAAQIERALARHGVV